MPLKNASRQWRSMGGSSRSASTQVLIEVKCVGIKRLRIPLPSPRRSGSNATAMGNSRIPVKVTASATSNIVAPEPKAEIMMTWAGAAQTSTVDSASHQADRPMP